MVTNNTKNQVKALYKKLKEANASNLSISKCNGYIQHLEYLKDLLYGIGDRWIRDLEEVEEIGESFFEEDEEDDLEETIEQMLDQVEIIMTRLGIEEYEKTQEHTSNSSPTNIHFSPNFSQSQNTNVSVNTSQFNQTLQAINQELEKEKPSKSLLKSLLETLRKSVLGF